MDLPPPCEHMQTASASNEIVAVLRSSNFCIITEALLLVLVLLPAIAASASATITTIVPISARSVGIIAPVILLVLVAVSLVPVLV